MTEREAIRIDPATGRKRFDTRAAANPRVQGAGYRVIDDERLTTLPEQPAGASFDDDARDRYRRDKQLREGSGDFLAIDGEFSRYLVDHYSSERVEREALDDECEVLVVGAGFAGLLLWYRLSQSGFDDVRFCERGGDVGGTWYWNRYPGVACDVEAYSYLPLLEEMGYVPSVKFASGFEILDYCRRMAERFDFYDRCLFHTSVTGVDWDDTGQRWTVRTDRGDEMHARHVILANGILTTPQLANIPGIDRFEGESFHTSRWNYDVDLAGKRIGVIGTGATAVQAVPELAKVAGELFVFQRTPSTVDVRDQRETTDEERAKWAAEPGWAVARRARFAKISAGRTALQANDAYLAGEMDDWKERKEHDGDLTTEEYVEKLLDTNFRIMEQIRARVDAVVDDPATAEALKPWYPYGCKRPTFHDEYLPSFNLPHVHLVDCAPEGVRQITERGVVHDGEEYELDVLIFATGFRFFASDVFDMVRGRDGRSITDKWADGGTRSFLGVHHEGFPNLYVITGPQGGGGSFNFTDSIEDHVNHVVRTLTLLRERGADTIEPTAEAEERWARHCARADSMSAALRDCVSYYNGYGGAEPGSLAYYGGARRWRDRASTALDALDPFVMT
ncbi:MAG: flavin-containing monooxygenase [Ilumatobacter sp.]|uniref:flavin-containing monooxygenase n=1 Tax=Ilumatobacter sp. TaxID=1967498 RepID=UPI003918FEFC